MVSDFLRGKVIGEDITIRVYAGVCQPAVLLQVFIHSPVQPAAPARHLVGRVKKYENIGIGQPLPHGRHIRMFLSDMAEPDVFQIEACDQGGFSRSAGTDYTNQPCFLMYLSKFCHEK